MNTNSGWIESMQGGGSSTTTEPDLSIVIVSYNAGASLERCLQSLVAATEGVVSEIIVVDNHSSDGTPTRVRAHSPGVLVLENEENLGFSRAFNRGARRAKAPMILSLNGDCFPEPRSLSILLDEIHHAPRTGAMGPKLLLPDGRDARSAFRFPSLSRPTLDVRFARLFTGERFALHYPHGDRRLRSGGAVDWLSGACLLFRKEALEALDFFSERYFMYFEDVDVCRRLWSEGWEVVYCTRARATHEGGASSAGLLDRLALERQRSRLIYFSQHESRTSYHFMRLWTTTASILRSLRHLLTLRGESLRTEARILATAIRGVRD